MCFTAVCVHILRLTAISAVVHIGIRVLLSSHLCTFRGTLKREENADQYNK